MFLFASKARLRVLFGGAVLALDPLAAVLAAEADDDVELEAIIVTGSRIASGAEAALPVTVYGADELDALGVVNGDELTRSLPQLGDSTWHATWLAGGGNANAARGDVGSVNLKHLGASNTLLLINGRRSVVHSTMSTVDGGVSNVTYNSNAIPLYGLQSMEILRDGAAAVYGSDAVAGVVNFATMRDLHGGGALQAQYGTASHNPSDLEITGYFGMDFAAGRGNVTTSFGLNRRAGIDAADKWYTRTNDRRAFFPGTPLAGVTSLDGRSTSTPWALVRAVGPAATATPVAQTVRLNGTQFTSSGWFHIVPSSYVQTGAAGAVGTGSSLNNGSGLAYVADSSTATFLNGAGRSLRADVAEDVQITPDTDRASFFSNWSYEITDGIDAFGEVGWYRAWSDMTLGYGGTSTTQPIYIAANAYWNPLGTGPNRVAGLTGCASGCALELRNYQFADAGNGQVKVINNQSRLLGGLSGAWGAFDWESALLYTWSESTDRQRITNVNQLVAALNRTDASAYNPFNGGNIASPSAPGDTTRSNPDAFLGWSVRRNKSELKLWDFKVSNSDLLALPAGGLGAAIGIEFREESYKDDRDPSQSGALPFVDWYTGYTLGSSLAGHSPSPDIYSDRNVKSAFIEFAVPLVSAEWQVPLIHSLDLQIAGRAEDYSDVGSVAKPKFALAWNIIGGLTARGSWSEGFKAPNLEVIGSPLLVRFNGRTDWVRCQAAVNKAIAAGNAGATYATTGCSNFSYSTSSYRQGNPDLKPEESTSKSLGMLFEPTFLPDGAGRVSLSVDWWKTSIKGVIGILGEGNGLIIDAYERIVNGSTYSAVHRKPVTDEDIAFFAGSGLAAAGVPDYVDDRYQNLSPLTVEGLDIAANWRLSTLPFGNLTIGINASQLREYSQAMLTPLAAAFAAQQAGQLNPSITFPAAGANVVGTAVGTDGSSATSYPEWKVTGTVSWGLGPWHARGSAQYLDELSIGTWPDGSRFVVPATTRFNLSAGYTFEQADGLLSEMELEVGGRNITDKDPPLTATGAYLAASYQPYGRYWYANVSKKF